MLRGLVPSSPSGHRRRSALGGVAAVAALAVAAAPAAVAAPVAGATLATAALTTAALTTAAVAGRTLIAGPESATGDAVVTGRLADRQMRVEVDLTPAHPAALAAELAGLYDPSSAQYHRWLPAGAFAARYAPSRASVAAVDRYLTGSGLRIVASGSPFLAAAIGRSDTVAATFATSLRTERDPSGTTFWTTATAPSVPTTLAASVTGVVGLSDTVRIRAQRTRVAAGAAQPRYGAGRRPAA